MKLQQIFLSLNQVGMKLSMLSIWVSDYLLSHTPSPVMRNSTSILPLQSYLNFENISAERLQVTKTSNQRFAFK
jgi:uncharacterized protein (DUF427 family)